MLLQTPTTASWVEEKDEVAEVSQSGRRPVAQGWIDLQQGGERSRRSKQFVQLRTDPTASVLKVIIEKCAVREVMRTIGQDGEPSSACAAADADSSSADNNG
ncbi:hypothetical protein C0Q70_20443 [Pomacea canaliculata]|uniref:Uncharacterized protein n=1 Tax=Pomacea canaliculata TaxID=400727 RepID=A0A2T7NFJ3_POMCA|nr:hypothetical protein C0Q70_20443 [Pomacea canaliculata]